MKTQEQAQKAAEELATRMGRDWNIRVWKNLEWCYRLTKGPISLHNSHDYPDGKVRYFCLISDEIDKADGGTIIWHTDTHDLDPKESVKKACKRVSHVVSNLVEIRSFCETAWLDLLETVPSIK